MAEMLENKGFYRTQSKNATELIIEVTKMHFSSTMYCSRIKYIKEGNKTTISSPLNGTAKHVII